MPHRWLLVTKDGSATAVAGSIYEGPCRECFYCRKFGGTPLSGGAGGPDVSGGAPGGM
jgi:hypothetical protein